MADATNRFSTRRPRTVPGFSLSRRWGGLLALSIAMGPAMLGCDSVFYYPDARVRGTPRDHNLAFEDVHFTASDGTRLHGWFLPASKKPAVATVLHLHGNAANITGHYEFVHWLPAWGYNVLVFDYRGYGSSDGRVTREGTLADSLAALDYLRGRPDVEKNRILLFGQSLGGTLAAQVAAQRHNQVRAVALDSTFTSYREIVRHHVSAKPLLTVVAWWYPFMVPPGQDAIDAVPKLSPMPVFFMHGKADDIVPWTMSQELFRAAKEPKELWLVDGAGHTEAWASHRDEARTKLTRFFESSLGKSPTTRPGRTTTSRPAAHPSDASIPP